MFPYNSSEQKPSLPVASSTATFQSRTSILRIASMLVAVPRLRSCSCSLTIAPSLPSCCSSLLIALSCPFLPSPLLLHFSSSLIRSSTSLLLLTDYPAIHILESPLPYGVPSRRMNETMSCSTNKEQHKWVMIICLCVIYHIYTHC